MSAILSNPITVTITAANASGMLTCASTTGVLVGQEGSLSKVGVASVQIQVTELLSTTTFRACLAPLRGPPNAVMFSDLSAFNGGAATYQTDRQVVGGQQPV